jgi:hypothetical protein
MTPQGLTWQVKNIPALAEVWNLAKKNFLVTKWWRGPYHRETPEGDQMYKGTLLPPLQLYKMNIGFELTCRSQAIPRQIRT